jgi:thiol-disulfide isomerase/thioredoxin
MGIQELEAGTVRAHELYGDYWFNGEPVPILAQRGNVVLLDFWDYSSAVCLHSIAYIKDWAEKYVPHGLVVVGVHTPRFTFGRDPENVQRALHRLGITYPVVMDNEALAWSHYGNRIWPAQHLIDRDGYVRLVNAGGGKFGATEHALQTLLLSAGLINTLPSPTAAMADTDRTGSVCYRATPELFAGYLRGSMGNIEGYAPESAIHYADPGIYLEGKFYVSGDWSNDREDLRLVGEHPGHMVVRYAALQVEAVLSGAGRGGVEIEVRQDGDFLTERNRGSDVRVGDDGRSILTVHEPRSYELVSNREHGEHLLKLTSSGGMSLYALSFAPGAIPELISG